MFSSSSTIALNKGIVGAHNDIAPQGDGIKNMNIFSCNSGMNSTCTMIIIIKVVRCTMSLI